MEFCLTAPATALLPLLPKWRQLVPHISNQRYDKEKLRIRIASFYTGYTETCPSAQEIDGIIEIIWESGRVFERVHTPLDGELLPLVHPYAHLQLRICNQQVTYEELLRRIADYFSERQWAHTPVQSLAAKVWAASRPIF